MTTENYTYNAANMLLTRGANNYTSDANGNTLTGGGRTNTWDGQNRLTSITQGGVTTTHTYGSDGLRRQSVKGQQITDYVLDGQSAIRTVVNGNVDRTHLHGARGPEYERVGNNAPVARGSGKRRNETPEDWDRGRAGEPRQHVELNAIDTFGVGQALGAACLTYAMASLGALAWDIAESL